ncbi:Steroid 5 alpha-reductase 3, partial [Quaeritorhiza haematococci]
MNYGKTLENRTRPKSKEDSSKTSETMPTSQSNYPAMVSQLRDITVPKKWFWHFYAFAAPYCGCILFECLTKFVSRTPESASTPLLTFLGTWFATATNRPPPSSISQTPQPLQVILVLSLLQLQTIRRLYESLFIVSGNSSSARLNLGMYLFGWAYYIVAPFALTVDGLGWFTTTGHPVGGSTAIAQVWKDLMSWNYVVGVILYAYAAWRQNVAHRYLASLRSSVVDSVGAKTATEKKKDAKGRRPVYPLPSGGDFRYILFPHYTFEILIYFAFWLITIPPVPE